MIVESKRLDWQQSCRIAVDVLRALEYAHGRGVIHRDMKPSNVLVRDADGAATVMDFGIAKMTTSTKLTATGQTMGTVRYMSPEQVRGQEVDLRTDLYSLGATLYESLVGDTPFDGATHFEIMTKHLSEAPKRPSSIGVEVPSDVEDALMRSLAKRADDRQATARELRKVLEAALRDGDLGLVETQRVNREHLSSSTIPPLSSSLSSGIPAPSAGVPTGPTTAPPMRAATAADLADELEPGNSQQLAKKKRSRAPLWVGVGVLVAGGGAAGAMLYMKKTATPDVPAPVGFTIPGVTWATSARSADKAVAVQACDAIDAAAVGSAFDKALDEFRAFAKTNKLPVDIVNPLTELYAVPAAGLCEPTLYSDDVMLKKCGTAVSAIDEQHPYRLLVIADSTKLAAAMREGVANAACYNHAQPQDDAVCDLSAKFTEHH
jgi:serine/threonine-protein kinase